MLHLGFGQEVVKNNKSKHGNGDQRVLNRLGQARDVIATGILRFRSIYISSLNIKLAVLRVGFRVLIYLTEKV